MTSTRYESAREKGDDHMAVAEARQETRIGETRPSGSSELNALLGRGSEFDGKLTFEGTVRIDGTFTGEITTSDTLIVGEGAKVQGDISTPSLVVERGVLFQGASKMTEQAASNVVRFGATVESASD